MRKDWLNIFGFALTILTIIGTFIFTQGKISNKIESFEDTAKTHSVRINKAEEDIDELNVSVARLETKIDEWGKRLSMLIVEN